MSYRLKDVVFERAPFWVLRVPKGFEVYENVGTHAVRRGFVGYVGSDGLDRAKAQIERRIGEPTEPSPASQENA